MKKLLLKFLQNSQENICTTDSFLTKLQAEAFNFKETLVQVFSGEVCEISKKTFLTQHLRVTNCFWKYKNCITLSNRSFSEKSDYFFA